MKFLALLAGATLLASPALANSFINGGFETLTNGPGQLGYNTDATGWTTTGYNFVFAAGTGDTTGANGQYGGLSLWGPNNGAANGLTASSQQGGNFVGADGDYNVGPISQVITGLKVGHTYTIGYDYAFAQQSGFNGETVQNWTSSFGGVTTTTTSNLLTDYTLPNHGFSGWMHTSYTAVATSSTETLSFLAYGNLPIPPFALLDGVSVSGEPEPASWALLIVGFGLVGAAARRRRTTTVAA